MSLIFGARFAKKFELEVWIAARGREYGTESHEQYQKISTKIREADAEGAGLRSHWRACMGDAKRPSADAKMQELM